MLAIVHVKEFLLNNTKLGEIFVTDHYRYPVKLNNVLGRSSFIVNQDLC